MCLNKELLISTQHSKNTDSIRFKGTNTFSYVCRYLCLYTLAVTTTQISPLPLLSGKYEKIYINNSYFHPFTDNMQKLSSCVLPQKTSSQWGLGKVSALCMSWIYYQNNHTQVYVLCCWHLKYQINTYLPLCTQTILSLLLPLSEFCPYIWLFMGLETPRVSKR